MKETSKKLKNEKINTLNLIAKLEENNKVFNKLYDELKNKKFWDNYNYIIEYFVCLLNDNKYNIAINSTYRNAVYFVLK